MPLFFHTFQPTPASLSIYWDRLFLANQRPFGNPDGFPDSWVATFFPLVNHDTTAIDPDADPDGDEHTNFEEFLAGTDPLDANSHIQFLSVDATTATWSAQPFDLYLIQRNTDLNNTGGWANLKGIIPTNTTGSVSDHRGSGPREFFRLFRVP